MTPVSKHMLRALLGVCACTCALLVALPAQAASTAAAAKTPCWKLLLNEWYGGRIVHIYPIPCYQQAIDHLPTDIQVYSNAREDIERALQLAIAHKKNPSAPAPTITSSEPATGSTGSTGATGATGAAGRVTPSGPIPSAINNSSPGGATSFPLPLIILGGLAIFLLVAGGIGLVVRRMQDRGGPGTA